MILSNINTSQVTNMDYMFNGCSNLKYINLNNMKIGDNVADKRIIDNNLINPIICMKDQDSFYKILSHLEGLLINCSSPNLGKYANKTIDNKNNLCRKNHLLSKYDSNNENELKEIKEDVSPYELFNSFFTIQNEREMNKEEDEYIKSVIESLWEDE